MDISRAKLRNKLAFEEEVRNDAYYDEVPNEESERGYLTVGIGHRVDKDTTRLLGREIKEHDIITPEEIDILFNDDYETHFMPLTRMEGWDELPENYKLVISDMSWNQGSVLSPTNYKNAYWYYWGWSKAKTPEAKASFLEMFKHELFYSDPYNNRAENREYPKQNQTQVLNPKRAKWASQVPNRWRRNWNIINEGVK